MSNDTANATAAPPTPMPTVMTHADHPVTHSPTAKPNGDYTIEPFLVQFRDVPTGFDVLFPLAALIWFLANQVLEYRQRKKFHITANVFNVIAVGTAPFAASIIFVSLYYFMCTLFRAVRYYLPGSYPEMVNVWRLIQGFFLCLIIAMASSRIGKACMWVTFTASLVNTFTTRRDYPRPDSAESGMQFSNAFLFRLFAADTFVWFIAGICFESRIPVVTWLLPCLASAAKYFLLDRFERTESSSVIINVPTADLGADDAFSAHETVGKVSIP